MISADAMAMTAGARGSVQADDTAAGRRFAVMLLLASVLIVPLFALLTGPLAREQSASALYFSLSLMSLSHGGLSGIFWLDRRYRRHIAAEPVRYYGVAGAVSALSLLATLIWGEAFYHLFFVVVLVWTSIHFARQNWGVLCLAALGTRSPRPSRVENWSCWVTCAGGVIGQLPTVAPELLFDGAWTFGLFLVLAGMALSWMPACALARAGVHPARLALTLAIPAFFAPVFLMGPVVGGVAMGAVHAAQYMIILTVLATDREQGSVTPRVAGMLFAAAIYLALAVLLNASLIWGAWLRPAQVILTGVVLVHFSADAGLFRLRQPFQRAAMKQSFPFLFAR